MPKTCANCHWLEADYEDASDGAWMNRPYTVCRARNAVSNLRQFPFTKTDCGEHKPKSS